MGYQASVTSTTSLATTASVSANMNALCILDTNCFFTERARSYSSFNEVMEDTAIPVSSKAYVALQSAFSAPNAAVPIWLAKRDADTLLLNVSDVTVGSVYSLTLVYGTDTVVISYTVVTDDEVADIVEGLQEEIDNQGLEGFSYNEDNTNALELYLNTALSLAVSDISGFSAITPTTTESLSTAYAEVLLAINEEFYFLTYTGKDYTEAATLASLVETTDSSDYPKMLLLSTGDPLCLIAETEPPTDYIGKLKALNYTRTAVVWNNQAEYTGDAMTTSTFQEMYIAALMGQFEAGTTNWKFQKVSGLVAASDPSTGQVLTSRKQGYLVDRNANWCGYERGVNYLHGGSTVSGEWIDTIHFKDWLNNEIEVQLQNFLLNVGAAGKKVSFSQADLTNVVSIVNNVLVEGVTRGALKGYLPAVVPETVPFADQASRLLQDISWVAYLAGAINYVVVDGVLTYSENVA